MSSQAVPVLIFWILVISVAARTYIKTSFARKCLTFPFPLTTIENYVQNPNSIIQLDEEREFKITVNKKINQNNEYSFDVLVSPFQLQETKPATDLQNLLSTVINECYDIQQNPSAYEGKHELVDWVSFEPDAGTSATDCVDSSASTNSPIPITTLTRKTIYQYNLLHRGIGIIVMNQKGEIYIHKRSNQKKVFPSMLDMFVGGVMNTQDESPDITMLRELQEELGLDLSTAVERLHLSKSFNPNTQSKAAAGEAEETKAALVNNSNKLKSISSRIKHLRDDVELLSAVPVFQENTCLFQLSEYAKSIKQKPKIKNTISNNINSNFVDGDQRTNREEEAHIFRLGKSTCCTSYNHCIVDCYLVICNDVQADSIHFADGEVEWGKWTEVRELYQLVQEQESQFVPDGIQVWNDLPKLIVGR